jgi:glycosidase
MSRLLLYEINTRCWLRELSEGAGKRIDLGNVPESEFIQWQRLGFTHLWLMGVWQTGSRAKTHYLNLPDTPGHLQQVLPDWSADDVSGSPYAVAEYQVDESLGGEESLKAFRERLHRSGIKLLLDFVPNHLGLDHPWLRERPELFVPASPGVPGVFRQEAQGKTHWLAHGKDPYFPAWVDTAQLDYRRADTRAAMIEQLRFVASRCDGVRCDMAMLLLNDVFNRTWQNFDGASPPPDSEFWAEAIQAVKRPEFLFLAEAYWDLEERLQSLGFDFTYDKRVTDFIVERRPSELRRHLLRKSPGFLQRSVHFLENHDEPRIASRLSLAEHRAAALLMLALPGMTLLHDGQLTGARIHTSVHLNRRQRETADAGIAAFYDELLLTLPRTAVGRGEGRLLQPPSISGGEELADDLIVVHWHAEGPDFELAVINLTPNARESRAVLPMVEFRDRDWRVFDWLNDRSGACPVEFSTTPAILLKAPAYSAQLLHFSPGD